MIRGHLARLAALAALLAAARAATAPPPFTLEDLGTGAPGPANCSFDDASSLGANWLEITQVGRAGGGPRGAPPPTTRSTLRAAAHAAARRLPAACRRLSRPLASLRRPSPVPQQILNFTQYSSLPGADLSTMPDPVPMPYTLSASDTKAPGWLSV